MAVPNPLPNALTLKPPLVAALLGLAELTTAASYDTKLLALPRCLPTVAKTKPAPADPTPTPHATRAIIKLSLLQTLASAAVAAFELDAVEARRRPLKPTTPNPLPNALTLKPPLVAVLLVPIVELIGAS